MGRPLAPLQSGRSVWAQLPSPCLPWPRLALKFPGFCARKQDPVTAGLLELCSSFHRVGGGVRSWSFLKERLSSCSPCAPWAVCRALRQKGREKNKMKETEVDSFCIVMICMCVCVCVVRTFKVSPRGRFQVHAAGLLTMDTLLDIRTYPELPQLLNESSYPSISLFLSNPPPPPRSLAAVMRDLCF